MRDTRDLLLFSEALLRLGIARLMLLVLPFRLIAQKLGTPASPPADQAASRRLDDAAARIRWALLAAARRAPWRCQCLEQSIAGKMMLRARGIPATLYLGVEKHDDAIRAHAWLRCGSIFVTGGDGSTRYSIVSSLG